LLTERKCNQLGHRDVVDLFETIFFGWQARHERRCAPPQNPPQTALTFLLCFVVQRWQNLKPKSQNLIVTNLLNALGPYPGNVAFSPLLVALVDLETRDGKVPLQLLFKESNNLFRFLVV